jgi:hypothetical protein
MSADKKVIFVKGGAPGGKDLIKVGDRPIGSVGGVTYSLIRDLLTDLGIYQEVHHASK